jgi:hypothetical protein
MKRSDIPDDILLFAGYTLAHAAYSVSDVEEGESLIPFALIEIDGEQRITRFESETQADAIASGKQFIAGIREKSDLWTLGREGTMKESREKDVDVLVVSAGCDDLAESLVVIQPFRPNRGRDEFAILPHGVVAVGDQFDEDEEQARLIAVVLQGVTYHPQAALWNIWQKRGANIA